MDADSNTDLNMLPQPFVSDSGGNSSQAGMSIVAM
jgi:hypothetical protein